MKAQERLDKILTLANEKTEEEVSALIGATVKLSAFSNSLVSKEDYFSGLLGNKIIAKMDVTGELEGKGCLVIDLKDGIRLGGILIMLPQAELEEVVKNESYSEETEDSYGEIANIIAGSFTKTFEENHPQNFRFVRKEQKIVSPLKVDIASEEPVPDQYYYLVRGKLDIGGNGGGSLDFLMPAEPFGIEIPQKKNSEVKEQQEEVVTELSAEKQKIPGADAKEEHVEKEISSAKGPQENETLEEQISEKKQIDTKKQKKLVDSLLTKSCETLADEVGALLGVSVKLGKPQNSFVDKEKFFMEEVSGKQVLARMDIVDGLEGVGYLAVSLNDAIRIGGILIMLPPNELDIAVNEGEFSADVEDAYGEIANIIAGAYTSIFQDQYTPSIRFVKKGLEAVSPMKVDIPSEDAIPNVQYYQNKCSLEINGVQYGSVYFLLPAELFLLLGNEEEQELKEVKGISNADSAESRIMESAGSEDNEPYDVLIIQSNKDEAVRIEQELQKIGILSRIISYNDSIKYFVRENLRLVVIVMKDIDEQAYGVTIQVNTLSSVPIVAVGAQWTRTKVIKAVKYGVTDILLIPATPDEIRDKLNTNMLQMAA